MDIPGSACYGRLEPFARGPDGRAVSGCSREEPGKRKREDCKEARVNESYSLDNVVGAELELDDGTRYRVQT